MDGYSGEHECDDSRIKTCRETTDTVDVIQHLSVTSEMCSLQYIFGIKIFGILQCIPLFTH